jgi:polyphosphate kinase
VVRMENGVIRRYCHLGTGNYNPKTARIYEDLGILTADPRVGADLTDLFNTLTGYSRQTTYRSLMVAPHGIRNGLLEKIRREARHAGEGKPAGIRIKVNSLVDEQLIDALYQASRAGVPVELVIRGICALRPGVPGLSENIRVRSIVGRFLEHSRVISFANGGTPEWWLGSADLMHRNLDRRVEVLLRVNDAAAARQLQRIFDAAMAPDVRSWQLAGDGSWTRTGERDHQAELLAMRGENTG